MILVPITSGQKLRWQTKNSDLFRGCIWGTLEKVLIEYEKDGKFSNFFDYYFVWLA